MMPVYLMHYLVQETALSLALDSQSMNMVSATGTNYPALLILGSLVSVLSNSGARMKASSLSKPRTMSYSVVFVSSLSSPQSASAYTSPTQRHQARVLNRLPRLPRAPGRPGTPP